MRTPTRLGLESLHARVVPSATPLFAVGQDAGGASVVRVYNADGTLSRSLDPFGPGFTGGVRVATADTSGDGTDDIVATAGVGGGPAVKVFDGVTGNVVREFFAYDQSYRGGVNVAAGDITGDGVADIVVGTGVGGGPNVKAFDGGTGELLHSFFAYESSFRGGVNVGVGDVNGDGRAEVVTGTGYGGGPRVQVFDTLTWAETANFFAYDANVRSGVTVAAGDVTRDGRAEIVTGAGCGNGPNVRVFDGTGESLLTSFFAFDARFRGGVSVGVVAGNILAAPGPGRGVTVAVFTGNGTAVGTIDPFPGFAGGVTTGQGVAMPVARRPDLTTQKQAVPPPAPSGGTGHDPSASAPVAAGGDADYVPMYPDDYEWEPVYTSDPGFPLTDYGEPGWFDDNWYF